MLVAARSPLAAVVALAALVAPACADRPQPGSSDLGREFSEHLCTIQADCGCDEELLIPQCERQVEHEFQKRERVALDRGFVLDAECFDQFLVDIDSHGSCERAVPAYHPPCPSYTRNAGPGEPCETIGLVPLMMDCRIGLSCIDGVCRDLETPHILTEGEICSDTQGNTATGFLGQCAESLTCDSRDTRTCIPAPYWPKLPAGEECSSIVLCESSGYCQPQGTAPEDISEDDPGICTQKTEPGGACTYVTECTTHCDEGTCALRPVTMCAFLEAWWLAPDWLQEYGS